MTILSFIDRLRRSRADKAAGERQRRLDAATATLKAMAEGGGSYYARSVNRLFLDGGSPEGFDVCVKLGWAEPAGTIEGERYGRLTDVGRRLAGTYSAPLSRRYA